MEYSKFHSGIFGRMESAADDDFEITDDGCYSDYAITEDSVLLKAEIDLKSDQTEQAIRGELKAVFKKRYPDIGLYEEGTERTYHYNSERQSFMGF